jgi:hypothetical protein
VVVTGDARASESGGSHRAVASPALLHLSGIHSATPAVARLRSAAVQVREAIQRWLGTTANPAVHLQAHITMLALLGRSVAAARPAAQTALAPARNVRQFRTSFIVCGRRSAKIATRKASAHG